MRILQEKRIAEPMDCPYLPERQFVQEYFYADQLSESEWESYLSSGWRHFGAFFFRPCCPACSECRPIRVVNSDFVQSKSQRRVTKRNKETEVKFIRSMYHPDFFRIYEKHSRLKFNQKVDEKQFRESFFYNSVPQFLSLYFIEKQLAGLGFLDCAASGFSSIYFAYDPDFKKSGLGTFSIIKEIEFSLKSGYPFYYLGYYISDCSRMNYKGRFKPYELYDWKSESWKRISESEIKMSDKIDV